MEILQADEQHIPAIQHIYAHHVRYGCASFETDPPDEATMLARLQKITDAGLPWFVALEDGVVMGYCYLSRWRERFAYRFTVEDSVYIDQRFTGRGIGRQLLAHALAWAEQQGFRQMIGVVGDSQNSASIALHRSAGFSLTGTLRAVGFKHGRWLDTVIMQRELGAGDSTPP